MIVANSEYWVWPRGENFKFTKNFSSHEFECKCGLCVWQIMSKIHLVKIQIVRAELHYPITVNSGFRCSSHNIAVGGALDSNHLYGLAGDYAVKGMSGRSLETFFSDHFDRLGIGENFIHADVALGRARWEYPTKGN